MSTRIPLLLIILLRIRTILGPMTCPATIPAGHVSWWNKRIPWSYGALWKRYSKCLLETSLCLILLLWWPVPKSVHVIFFLITTLHEDPNKIGTT